MAHKVYSHPETPICFKPAANAFPTGVGIPSGVSVTFSVDSLPSGQGRISNQYDLGVGPRATLFEWRAKAVLASTSGALGASVEAYICTSNSVCNDGSLTQADAALTDAERRRNLQYVGAVVVDTTGVGAGNLQSAGLVEIFGRYISATWWNNTNLPLSTGNYFILTPVPDEIQ